MAKCKVCGFRLTDGTKKCPMCEAMPGSTKPRELANAAHLPKYLCPSCKVEIIGEHRYCPACMKELNEVAKKADVQEQDSNDCIQCGVSLPVGAKFCHECGTKQENNGPHCDAILLPNAKFCNECGSKQEAEPSAKSTKDNATNASNRIQETPLEAFEYEVHSGKYILTGVKDITLTDIVIPRVLSIIGSKIFSDRIDLTNIDIPHSVTRIDNNAFQFCESLKHVSIESPTFKESNLNRVFGDFPSLTEVKIGNEIIKISD